MQYILVYLLKEKKKKKGILKHGIYTALLWLESKFFLEKLDKN